MNPAEFKTISESLGLTAHWLADRFVVNLRTIQYWQSGRRGRVPDDVAEEILELEGIIDNFVVQSLKDFTPVIEAEIGIILLRYRNKSEMWSAIPQLRGLPLPCHATALARIRRRVRELGGTCSIEWDNSND